MLYLLMFKIPTDMVAPTPRPSACTFSLWVCLLPAYDFFFFFSKLHQLSYKTPRPTLRPPSYLKLAHKRATTS